MLTAEAVAQGLNLDKTPMASQPESSGSKGTSRKPRIKYDPLPSQRKFHDSETKFKGQEVLGEYLNLLSGRVYYAFDRRVHTGEFVCDPMEPLLWSLDFNVNPMCSVIGQLGNDRVVMLDELFLPDSSTSQACDAFYDNGEVV